MKTPGPFQFGILRLLILTTAVAMIIAVSTRIAAPFLFQAVLAAYLLFFVCWIIMRAPNMVRNLSELRQRRRQQQRHRIELESDVRNRVSKDAGGLPRRLNTPDG